MLRHLYGRGIPQNLVSGRLVLSVCLLVCARRYGWGRNAPKLDLPKGVGFSVGKGSAIAWVVAQVHFLGQRPDGNVAGVRLK